MEIHGHVLQSQHCPSLMKDILIWNKIFRFLHSAQFYERIWDANHNANHTPNDD